MRPSPSLAAFLLSSSALLLAGCAGPRSAGAPGATGPEAATRPAQAAQPTQGAQAAADGAKVRSMAQILEEAPRSEWQPIPPEDTLVMDLASGRVVIELAPAFAPNHAANVRALARARYFDGLAVVRVQDGFVVQWGDPHADEPGLARPVVGAARSLPAELARPLAGVPFTRLPDGDVYAPEVGFSEGRPVARDPSAGLAWLAHCYGMVGVGRDVAADSGSGAELYVVIGHAPRQLDRNATVVGRVVQGLELLTALPRGPAPMGFHEDPARRTPITALRVAADLPPAERPALERLRTDGATFEALVEARRSRRDGWYLAPAGRIDLCNVPLPVRPVARPQGG